MRSRCLVLAVMLFLGLIAMPGVVSADDAPEQRIVDLVNAERARHGLHPLTVSPELTSSARAYANAMASEGFFGHVGPDGSTLVSRNEAAGYQHWRYLAENLAAGQTTPEQAIAGWLASPSHRAALLSPEVDEIGVGHVHRVGSKYGNYWVQEFGSCRSLAPIRATSHTIDCPRTSATCLGTA